MSESLIAAIEAYKLDRCPPDEGWTNTQAGIELACNECIRIIKKHMGDVHVARGESIARDSNRAADGWESRPSPATTSTLNQKPLYPPVDRRSKEPQYFDGMKCFKHPRLGAKFNRRLPGANQWQEEKSVSSEIRLLDCRDDFDKYIEGRGLTPTNDEWLAWQKAWGLAYLQGRDHAKRDYGILQKREYRPATMNRLISIVGAAAVENKGILTWEQGLQAILKHCDIINKPVIEDGKSDA